jgi:hypothetical protein
MSLGNSEYHDSGSNEWSILGVAIVASQPVSLSSESSINFKSSISASSYCQLQEINYSLCRQLGPDQSPSLYPRHLQPYGAPLAPLHHDVQPIQQCLH